MPSIPVRKAYKIRSPETWDLIRSAYVRGETAASLAERFDVTEDAIRNRARKEGWTKRAYAARMEGEPLAAAPPTRRAGAPVDAPSPAAFPAVSASSVAEQAVAAAGRAIAEGRFMEAERLAKMAETLSRLGGGSGGPGFAPHAAIRGSSDPWDTPARDEPREKTPEEMMAMRKEVERRFERLARSFDPKPTLHPLVVAYGLENAYEVVEEEEP